MLSQQDTCPVCGQTFSGSDDVVYCPDCGAPHHRACWMQNGRCAHADLHADGYVWRSAAPQPEPQEPPHTQAHAEFHCPRCGAECGADTLVCPECGQRLGQMPGGTYDYNTDFFMRDVSADPNEDLGGMSVREASMFVQYRTRDYVRKFRRIHAGSKAGWNWAAFLLSPFWFFYRKIYKAGALFMGILLVLAVFMGIPMSKVQTQAMNTLTEFVTIEEDTTPEEIMAAIAKLDNAQKQKVQSAVLRYSQSLMLYLGVLFLPNIAAGLVADRLYRKKIVRDVRQLHDFAGNEQTFRLLMLRRGGVTLLGLVGSYIIVNLFFNLIFLYL